MRKKQVKSSTEPVFPDVIQPDSMEEKVKQAVVKVLYAISPDLGEGTTLDEAAEICLDADFPSTYGGM